MARFAIEHEWLSGTANAAASELQATWARFSLRVDGSPLIVGRDPETGVLRDSLIVPLYPVAEWIAFNWWLLFENTRTLVSAAVDPRCMIAIGDGFLWPNISFIPSGDSMRIEVAPWRSLPNQYLSFEGRTSIWLESAEVRQRFVDVVDSVLQQLNRAGVIGSPLQLEWERLQSLDSEEQMFCRMAANLGLDPFSEGVELERSISEAFSQLPTELIDEFASAVRADTLAESTLWVTDRIEELKSSPPAPPTLISLDAITTSVHSAKLATSPPWMQGYEAAKRVRQAVGMSPIDPVDSLPVAIIEPVKTTHLRELEAVGRRVGNEGLAIATGRPMRKETERFQAARVLALVAQEQQFEGYALSTSGHTPAQRASRAFAAELLAPADGIESYIGFAPTLDDDVAIEECAAHFGVSLLVIAHQLENQLLPG